MATINAIQDEYLTHIELVRGFSKATVSSYRGDLQLFSRFLDKLGIADLSQINGNILLQYFQEQQTLNPKKPATIRRRGHSLSSFFKYCCLRKYIPFNPITEVQLPKKEQRLPEFLTDTEIERFISTPIRYRKISWISKRDKAVLDTLIFTGCRRSELLSIRMNDVCLESKTLLIANGKGNRQRMIPLCPNLIKSLIDYLDVRPKVNTDCLFLASSGLTKLGNNGLYKLFKRHLHRCGIEKQGITLHSVRHTFATRVLRKSKDLVSVQKLLGHRSIDTTSIYLHITDEDMRRAVDSAF